MRVASSLALPFTNTGEKSGRVKGIARDTICNNGTETGPSGNRGRTYNMGNPQHKLGAIKDPMHIMIGKAVVIGVSSTCSRWVFEVFNNLLDLIIHDELTNH